MITFSLSAVALVVVTSFGLVNINDRDVVVRHGQSIADAVALAAVGGGTDAAAEVARRNESTLVAIDWSGVEGSSTVTVEVLVDGDESFRSRAIGG